MLNIILCDKLIVKTFVAYDKTLYLCTNKNQLTPKSRKGKTNMETISEQKRFSNIISRAIDLGFEFNAQDTFDDIVDSASDFIIEKVGVEEYSRADVSFGRDQNLTWGDGLGFWIESWGELASNDFRNRSYFRLVEGKRVDLKWFELPDENSEEWDGICLDMNTTVLDSNAKVICLYY